MADPTDLELRRQGMADAVVAITMTRRLPTLTVEEIGSWVGLRQREVIAAIKRMKNGDELVRRLITSATGPRTSTEIRLEIDQLKVELADTVKAEALAARERRQQARDAERAAARAAKEAERERARAAKEAERERARAAKEAERERARAVKVAEREAERLARIERGEVKHYNYRPTDPCPECGKQVRNLGVHQLSHRVSTCPHCHREFRGNGLATHLPRCKAASDAA